MLRLWGTAVSKELVVVSVTDITVSSLPCDAFGDPEVSGSYTRVREEQTKPMLSFVCTDISRLLF